MHTIPVLPVTFIDRSGSITTGGTAQTASSRTTRHYVFIQNPSAESESLWVNFGTTAVAASPSIELEPGQSYESGVACPQGAISVIAATTGHDFTIKEV